MPDWVHECMPSPTIVKEFDESLFTQGLIKSMLKKCSSMSSPGADGISYYHLKRLPSCHHFLATLYSKILLESQESPLHWCSGKIILIHKKSDTAQPGNYRPIALTSSISKLFHKNLARRLEHFCIANARQFKKVF